MLEKTNLHGPHFLKRRGKSDEELVEDPECVGNMKLNSEPTPEKKSLIYSYKFEEPRLSN